MALEEKGVQTIFLEGSQYDETPMGVVEYPESEAIDRHVSETGWDDQKMMNTMSSSSPWTCSPMEAAGVSTAKRSRTGAPWCTTTS